MLWIANGIENDFWKLCVCVVFIFLGDRMPTYSIMDLGCDPFRGQWGELANLSLSSNFSVSVTRGLGGWNSSITNGSEVLAISWENEFSKTYKGEWMIFIHVELYFLVSKVYKAVLKNVQLGI